MGGNDLPGLSFGDLMDREFPPRAPLVGSWLLERSLSMIHAPAGVGKSMLSLGLAIGLAGGQNFLKWPIPRAGRVLYLDAEMEPCELKGRACELVRASEMTKEQVRDLRDNLRILNQQNPSEPSKVPDLKADTEEAKEWLEDAVESFRADLVVIDNLSTFADVEDENSAGGFSFVVEIGQFLKGLGCAVLFVHHDRKGQSSSESFRGSGKLEAPLDTRWGMRKASGGEGFGFTIEPYKIRHRKGDDVYPFTAWLHTDGAGASWSHSDAPRTDDAVENYVNAVTSCSYAKAKEIAEAFGVSESTVSRWSKQAIAQKLITKEEEKECFRKSKEEGDF
ncbi:conserved hypothetical protein [Marinobacter salarius]|uniref:AAA family ATPase n=1 Tax=Marinobacter salarius TaxID=1420917 RepID=UPI00125A093D|nr:AAA family ATPase [Marinobacter salarius]VVT19901.1 conserved hypothetical protein [Marinobacter salarius]VXB86768.1 conserved hypothetical protein [Marinobacter salarius]